MSHAEMSSVAKNSLRVALLSDSDKQRENLKSLLESTGIQVVIDELMSAESIRSITSDCADVLLVDLDDDIEHDLDFLDEVLDSKLPVLFNDASSSRMRVAQKHGDWGRNLARKLAEMVPEIPSPVEPSAAIIEEKVLKLEDVALEQASNDEVTAKLEVVSSDEVINDEEIANEVVLSTPVSESVIDDVTEEESLSDAPVTEVADDEAVAPAVLAGPEDNIAEAEYLNSLEKKVLKRALEEENLQDNSEAEKTVTSTAEAKDVWVIGASIGGPQSVKRFFSCIQEQVPVAFVLAQHIGSNFIDLLATQLDKVTSLDVFPAQDGHKLEHNQVIIAPTNQRVTINAKGRVKLKPVDYESIYTPSIDTVMTDISTHYGVHTSSIIFSGMGCDGVRGSQLIAARGGKVWAQDKDSSVISSMPDASRRAGMVSFSGSPEALAGKLIEHFKPNEVRLQR